MKKADKEMRATLRDILQVQTGHEFREDIWEITIDWIIKAFENAGYSTFRDRDGSKWLTGAMWYENFKQEFVPFTGEDGPVMNDFVMEAAFRASSCCKHTPKTTLTRRME